MMGNPGCPSARYGNRLLALMSALVLVAVIWPQSAQADVRTEARSYFRTGMSLIQQGQIDEGVEQLLAAYDLLPHPNVLYNIARAYEELGEYPAVIEYYRRYLRDRVDPPDRARIEQHIASLEERQEEARQQNQRAPTTGTPRR